MIEEVCYTCRGLELLYPTEKGKCPASSFEICPKKKKVKSWMRVCAKHGQIELPSERVALIHMDLLKTLSFECGLKKIGQILKPYDMVLKIGS